MARILIASISTRYTHAALGPRYLIANLGALQAEAELREFLLSDSPDDIAERLLADSPLIVGLGVYIWNVEACTKLVEILKAVAPGVFVVLGGPEVSYGGEDQRIAALADYVIQGEGELAFAELCTQILNQSPPPQKFLKSAPPDLSSLILPYRWYSDTDAAQRTVYVEASRGCPYSCEFCLSSLDRTVRHFPITPLLGELEALLKRGARVFKFVDRTFNLQIESALRILEFFLEHITPDLYLHFEMVPDRLAAPLARMLQRFPPGTVQLEVGIQSFSPAVTERINRRQSPEESKANLRFLRQETGCYIHADLIAGLPGEDLQGLADSFDTLIGLQPHEIQLGILKNLKGTSLSRHCEPFSMRFSPLPPYEVLSTGSLDYATLRRLKRFARFFDLISNSGNFVQTAPLIWAGQPSPFFAFLQFSEWLYAKLSRSSSVALRVLSLYTARFLLEERRLDPALVLEALRADCQRTNRSDHELLSREMTATGPGASPPARKRQARHFKA